MSIWWWMMTMHDTIQYNIHACCCFPYQSIWQFDKVSLDSLSHSTYHYHYLDGFIQMKIVIINVILCGYCCCWQQKKKKIINQIHCWHIHTLIKCIIIIIMSITIQNSNVCTWYGWGGCCVVGVQIAKLTFRILWTTKKWWAKARKFQIINNKHFEFEIRNHPDCPIEWIYYIITCICVSRSFCE